MHHDFLDKYRDVPSLWAVRSPQFRLLWALVYVIATATLQVGWWAALALMASVLGITVILSRLPVGFAAVRTGLLSLPAVLIALPMAWFQADKVGWLGFIVAKALLAVGMMVTLISTTSFPEIINALRRARCPELLLSLLAFTYRYIFLLVEQSERLQMTYRCRVAGASPALKRRALGNIAATLFTRSLERSNRIYDAMLARGFNGTFPGLPSRRLTLIETVVLALLLLTSIGVRLLG